MNYLKIPNWKKWQSYRSDRGQPPWIKLHRALLRHPHWQLLDDAQKGHLASIWMLAADRDGEVPSDPLIIQKFCMLTNPPDMQLFMDLEFVERDANVTPSRRQRDANVTPQSRIDQSRIDQSKIKSNEFDGVALKNKEIKEKSKEVLAHLSRTIGKKLTMTKNIEACFRREKCSIKDCIMVIDYKWGEWVGTENQKHVNHTTLFRPSHFQAYLDMAKSGPMTARQAAAVPKDENGQPIPKWKQDMLRDIKEMDTKK